MSSGKSTLSKNKRIAGNLLNSLNCFYTNATSLINKWSDLNSLILVLNSPHIILITETWFNTLSICKLDNYNLFCKNREAVRGGGVAIYVRSDLESFEVSDGTLSNTRSEQVWCFVKVNNWGIVWVVVMAVRGIREMIFLDSNSINDVATKSIQLG